MKSNKLDPYTTKNMRCISKEIIFILYQKKINYIHIKQNKVHIQQIKFKYLPKKHYIHSTNKLQTFFF